MSTANAPARPGNAAQGQQQEGSLFRKIIGIAQQILFAWVIMQIASRFFAPQTSTSTPPAPSTGDISQLAGQQPSVAQASGAAQALPLWPLGIPLAMHVHLSTSPTGDVLEPQWKDEDTGLPSFVWDNITFGDWKESRTVEYDVDLPLTVQHNGSLWADVFLVRDGVSSDPSSTKHNSSVVHHFRKLLTHYFPREKIRKEKNLLKSGEEQEEEEELADVIVSHWHNNLTLALISDSPVIQLNQVTPPVAQFIEFVPPREKDGTIVTYKPIIFPNEFWHLRSQYVEINTTTPRLPLHVTFQPMSYWKFNLYASMTQGFKEAAKQNGGAGGAELDEIKRMLVETNPWFLGLTALVSVLHMVFEMLAFTSDVSHWRHKQELVGVSVRSIVTNVVVQTIILLYLIDNNEQTSWIILFSSGIGILIEAWKITKAVDISVVSADTGSWLPYKLDIKDKHVLSEDEKKTQEYDKLAFRIVAYFTVPCLAIYTGYSLFYETHRGWYSFVISTLTSFVYMFGFAQLIPQLIINYKLKSVAHMPMKAMIYKSLSTVVDDLFAFCIKMPFLHRLACFRDDVVFVVFLYQRWIYRIDPKRVNEYGQVMASEVDAAQEKEENERAETKKNK